MAIGYCKFAGSDASGRTLRDRNAPYQHASRRHRGRCRSMQSLARRTRQSFQATAPSLERGHPGSARKSNRPPCKRATLTPGWGAATSGRRAEADPRCLFRPAESLQVEAVPVVEYDAFLFQQALLEGIAAMAGEGLPPGRTAPLTMTLPSPVALLAITPLFLSRSGRASSGSA
jgi:hypothetical protein